MSQSYKNYDITTTNFHHPDIKTGQHTNGPGMVWVRHDGGEWLCTGLKQQHKVRLLIDTHGDSYAETLGCGLTIESIFMRKCRARCPKACKTYEKLNRKRKGRVWAGFRPASGLIICHVCERQYHDHPPHPHFPDLTITCEDGFVKL